MYDKTRLYYCGGQLSAPDVARLRAGARRRGTPPPGRKFRRTEKKHVSYRGNPRRRRCHRIVPRTSSRRTFIVYYYISIPSPRRVRTILFYKNMINTLPRPLHGVYNIYIHGNVYTGRSTVPDRATDGRKSNGPIFCCEGAPYSPVISSLHTVKSLEVDTSGNCKHFQ